MLTIVAQVFPMLHNQDLNLDVEANSCSGSFCDHESGEQGTPGCNQTWFKGLVLHAVNLIQSMTKGQPAPGNY